MANATSNSILGLTMTPVNFNRFIAEKLTDIGKPLNSIDTKIVLSDLIDERLGIFSHSRFSKQRPLASVAMHPAEDYTAESEAELLFNVYVDNSIYDFFHISLIDFMKLTPDTVNLLLDIAAKKKSQKNKENDDILKEIEASKKTNQK